MSNKAANSEFIANSQGSGGDWIDLGMADFMTKVASISLIDFPSVRRIADTEDIRQTAAERLIKAIRRVEPRSLEHVRSLAARQIRFTLLSHARKLKRRSTSTFVTPVSTEEGFLHLEELQPANETSTAEFEPWERLHRAIADLPADEKSVFELMWYHGFKSRQVADQLDLERKKVQRLFSRARTRLLPLLEDIRGCLD